MNKFFTLLVTLFCFTTSHAQTEMAYYSHLKNFRSKYVLRHEVVKSTDRKFLRFFLADYRYLINADFERINDTIGFPMLTSSGKSSKYFVYGKISFTFDEKTYKLYVYQSERLKSTRQYSNYIFIPFTDLTTGKESYGAGRYIDLSTKDVKGNVLTIDFNKAYNPYCAYSSGFSCPIPPRQNYLAFPVKAGERSFGKKSY